MYQRQFVLIIIIIVLFCPVTSAKKRCKPLLEKLHHIQSLQRNVHSAKSGLGLRNREDKARTLWWQCENGIRQEQQKSEQKNKQKSAVKQRNSSHSTQRKKYRAIKAGTPFSTHTAIVIKSKYQGKKKQAWHKFYQQPPQCVKPQNLTQFAFCSENKQAQQQAFERSYAK